MSYDDGARALAPVQADGGALLGAGVPQLAARGVAGASAPLPYAERIQASFGRHDVSGVRSQVAGPAAEASAAMGAQAYATGDRVAFAQAPDLHTAAHEAAHVVQQRAGVQLKGGVGRAGDRYERHADAVADRVVAGASAEGLLDAMAPCRGAASPGAAVQKKRTGGNGAPKKARQVRSLDFSGDVIDQLVAWLNPYSRPGSALSVGVTLGLSAELLKILELGGGVALDFEFATSDHGLYTAQMSLSGSVYAKVSAWMVEFQALKTVKKTWGCTANGLAELAGVVLAPLVAILRAARAKSKSAGGRPRSLNVGRGTHAKPGLDTKTYGTPSSRSVKIGGKVGKGDAAPGASLSYSYTSGAPTTEFSREVVGSDGKTKREYTLGKKKFSRHKVSFTTGPLFAGSIGLAYEKVEGDALVDNDGDYRTFDVELVAKKAPTNQALFNDYMTTLFVAHDFIYGVRGQLAGLGGNLLKSPATLKDLGAQLLKSLKDKNGPSLWDRVAKRFPTAPWKAKKMNPSQFFWLEYEKSKEKSGQMGVNFTLHQVSTQGDWATQYARISTVGGFDITASVPLYGAVKGSFGASFSRQSNVLEFAGGGTTTYFQTRYHGIALRTGYFSWDGGKDPEKKPQADGAWLGYAGTQSTPLQSVYLSLAERKGTPYEEVKSAESGDSALATSRGKLLAEADRYKAAAAPPSGAAAPPRGTAPIGAVNQALGDFFGTLPAVKGRAAKNRNEQQGFKERGGALANKEGDALHAKFSKGQPVSAYDMARLIRWYSSGLIVTVRWERWIGNVVNAAANRGLLEQVYNFVSLAHTVQYVKDSPASIIQIAACSWRGLLSRLLEQDPEGFAAHVAGLMNGNSPQQAVFNDLMRRANGHDHFGDVIKALGGVAKVQPKLKFEIQARCMPPKKGRK